MLEHDESARDTQQRSPPALAYREHVAYHEAGHALLWILQGVPFAVATIEEATGDKAAQLGISPCSGRVSGDYPILAADVSPQEHTAAHLGILAIGWGGLIGEYYSPHWATYQSQGGWEHDLEQNRANLLVWYPDATPAERQALYDESERLAYRLLGSPIAPNVVRLERLAWALLQHGTLTYQQAIDAMNDPTPIREEHHMGLFTRTPKDDPQPDPQDNQGTSPDNQQGSQGTAPVPKSRAMTSHDKLAHKREMAAMKAQERKDRRAEKQQERQERQAEQQQRRQERLAEKQRRRQEQHDQLQKVLSRIAAWRARKRAERPRQIARGGLRHAVHRFGHRYLKLLFVTALAASTSLFFIGRAIPNPPGIVIVVIGSILGAAIELSYYTVSCDLTDAITDGHKGSAVLNFCYTLIGAGASWFFFTNAALHVGWAPADDLIGLSRTAWAMIAGALVVGIVFVLSARRERPESATDLQAMARFVMVNTPDYSEEERLLALAGMANALRAARQGQTLAAPEPTVEALPGSRLSSNQEAMERIPAELRQGAKHISRVEQQGEEGEAESAYSDLPMPATRPVEQSNHPYAGKEGGSFRGSDSDES